MYDKEYTYLIICALIVLVLLFVVYRLYSSKYTNDCDSFDNTGVMNPALPNSTSLTNVIGVPDFNTSLLGDQNKLVRFKCKINGKTYYLMVTPITSCSNLTNLKGNCFTNTVVLVDENTVLQHIENYLGDVYDQQRVCNFQENLTCNKRMTRSSQNIGLAESLTPNVYSEVCPTTFSQCNMIKQYPTDFIIQKSTVGSGSTQYIITGISGRLGIDNTAAPYLLNQDIQNLNNMPDDLITETVLCADGMDSFQFNSIVNLITTKSNNSESNNSLRTKIRFNMLANPPQLDPNTNKAITRSFYVGACKNDICTENNTNYARICLFKNISDPNVLEFEPIVIYY